MLKRCRHRKRSRLSIGARFSTLIIWHSDWHGKAIMRGNKHARGAMRQISQARHKLARPMHRDAQSSAPANAEAVRAAVREAWETGGGGPSSYGGSRLIMAETASRTAIDEAHKAFDDAERTVSTLHEHLREARQSGAPSEAIKEAKSLLREAEMHRKKASKMVDGAVFSNPRNRVGIR